MKFSVSNLIVIALFSSIVSATTAYFVASSYLKSQPLTLVRTAREGTSNSTSETASTCEVEVLKYCQPTDDVCLKENVTHLPEVCRGPVEARLRKAIPGCETDVEKYCAGVPAGQGRIFKCLANFKDRLGAKCRERIEAVLNPAAPSSLPASLPAIDAKKEKK